MKKSVEKVVMMLAIILIAGTLLPGCGSKSLSEADVVTPALFWKTY